MSFENEKKLLIKNPNNIFLLLLIIFYLTIPINNQNSENWKENNMNNLIKDLNSNQIGKIIYNTIQIGYNSNPNALGNTEFIENYLKKYEILLQYKLNEFTENNKQEQISSNKCQINLKELHKKKSDIINTQKNSTKEKNLIKSYIQNLKNILNINGFFIKFFEKKQKFLNFLQKKFYLNNYLTIPIKEKLI